MTFDAPPGDTFVVAWNLTAEPIGKFTTVSARVALLDDNQNSLASVNFDTSCVLSHGNHRSRHGRVLDGVPVDTRLKRRSLADMAPFEMVLLVVLGDIIQQGVMQQDYSVTGALLALSAFGSGLPPSATSVGAGRRRDMSSMASQSCSSPMASRSIRLTRDGANAVGRSARSSSATRHRRHREDRLAVLEVSGKISIIQAG